MKKIIPAFIMALVFAISNIAYALPQHNGWATENIITANNAGLLVDMTDVPDFTAPISRNDVAELVVRAYINVTGESEFICEDYFTDVTSDYPQWAYSLSLMNGTDYNTFSPDAFTTREAMAKILLTLSARVKGEELLLPPDPLSHFTDFDAVSEWAKPYVALADTANLVRGFEDYTFRPQDLVTYEQAVAFICRAVTLKDTGSAVKWPSSGSSVIPEREINISGYVNPIQEFGNVRIRWNSGLYTTVTVTEDRNSYYTEDIAPRTTVYNGSGYIDIRLMTNCSYKIAVLGVGTVTFKTTKGANDGASLIKASYPTTKEQAEALQVDVTVPVWRMRTDGTKYEGAITLKVHKDIAERVKLVFDEIYNGPEKAPIRDAGAYAWRGGRSEHNGGTAIDLNANENYCLYSNGTVVGNYWKPNEDPYSFNPYGDVIYAFEKYGFTWGGDAWRGTKDYMHFSYLGT